MKISSITVYAASSARIHADYLEAAELLGRLIAEKKWRQVNGGGKTGLMGAATRGAVEAHGVVDAVILDIFTSANMHEGLNSVQVEDKMYKRKLGLFEAGDAFIALPGGLGTFDEVMEVLTLRQLGIHSKPVALVNTRGYFDRFAELIRHAIAEGFVHEEMWSDIAVVDTPEKAIEFVENYAPDEKDKGKIWSGDMSREKVDSDWTAAAAAAAPKENEANPSPI